MDPLTAFGLAASVLQVIDFSTKLASKSYEIHKSVTGSLVSHVSVEAATLRLTSLSEAIKESSQATSKDSLSNEPAQLALLEVATECLATAKELNGVLKNLKSKPDSKYESARAALRAIMKQKKLDDLESSLARCRQELLLNFVLIIQSDLGHIEQQLATMNEINIAGHRQTQLALRVAAENILNGIKSQQSANSSDVDLDKLSAELRLMNVHSAGEQALLDDLYLPVLEWRERQILRASDDTFDWIFENKSTKTSQDYTDDATANNGPHDTAESEPKAPTLEAAILTDMVEPSRSELPPTGFVDWLANGNGIFWITGKPGCGKSTLMKFIAEDPRTETALQQWVGQSELVTASAYFWISGDPRQRSILAIWRSMFHCILRKHSPLIRVLFPWRWRKYENCSSCAEQWREDEFVQALEKLSSLKGGEYRFCFFIDGLDEFEGDHRKLVVMLRKLVQSSHVKLCVSSRPWEVFCSSFATYPVIRVHEWTEADIREFIQQELGNHPQWHNLLVLEAKEVGDLVEDICWRSNGVFLWVHLVVQELRRSLDDGDDTSILWNHLKDMPPDLDKFFERMFDSLPDQHLKEAKEILTFQINFSKHGSSPYLPEFAFMGEKRPNFGEIAAVDLLSMPQLLAMYSSIKRRIKSRCRDLLDTTISLPELLTYPDILVANGLDKAQSRELWCLTESVVMFVHRSVADFLVTSGSRYILQDIDHELGNIEAGSDPWLLQYALAEVKRFPVRQMDQTQAWSDQSFLGSVNRWGRLARPHAPEGASISYLEELERAAHLTMDGTILEWSALPRFGERMTFLEMAVRWGFGVFVEQRMLRAGRIFDQASFEVFFHALSLHDTTASVNHFASLDVSCYNWAGRPSQAMVSVLERCSLQLHTDGHTAEYWVLEKYSEDWKPNMDWTWIRALLVAMDGSGGRRIHRQYYLSWE